MQLQKEEIRAKIYSSAVEEFLANGFKGASMRSIATRSGISVSNIYNYHKNKEGLFETIVHPAYVESTTVVKKLKELLHNSFVEESINVQDLIKALSDLLDKSALHHRNESLILFTCSKGSNYERFSNEYIAKCTQIIIREYEQHLIKRKTKKKVNRLFIETNVENFILNYFHILKKFNNSPHLKEILMKYQTYNTQGLLALLPNQQKPVK